MKLTAEERQALKEKFWTWIEPSIESYSKQLESALDAMSDLDLDRFIEERVGEK